MGAKNMKHLKRKRKSNVVWAALLLFAVAAIPTLVDAQDMAQFEKRMTKFTLDNGLNFLVLGYHGDCALV
jgi:hypothetical protein